MLKQRREYENSKNDQTLVRKLDFIITQLSRAQPEDWQRLIKKFKPYLEKTLPLLGVKIELLSKSNTLKLLTHLSNNDFDKAKDIIEKQKSGKKQNKLMENIGKGKKKIIESTSPTLFNNKPKNPDADKELSPDIIKHKAAITRIDAAIRAYNDQIDDLSSGCCTIFSCYEITTKTKKRDALASLLQTDTFTSMKIRAGKLMLDSRVMLYWDTKVTSDLLKLIVNDSEKLTQLTMENGASINTRKSDFTPCK